MSEKNENFEKNYVKLYLNFENYKNSNLNEFNYSHSKEEPKPNFICHRVCPPGDLYFFISRNGIPVTNYGNLNHQLKEIIVYTEDEKPIESEEEKKQKNKSKIKNNLKKFIITKVAHKKVEINPEVIDCKKYISKLQYCVPRPIYNRKLKAKDKGPWNFNNSIWKWYGYNLEGETEDAYNSAFEFDYDRCNLDKDRDLLEE